MPDQKVFPDFPIFAEFLFLNSQIFMIFEFSNFHVDNV